MPLRLTSAAIVGFLFLLMGLALGQTPAPGPDRTAPGVTLSDPDQTRERIQQRERTGTDPNVAFGTFGSTGRGAAHGPADSAPAPSLGDSRDTAAEPSGPGSAERRPGAATAQ